MPFVEFSAGGAVVIGLLAPLAALGLLVVILVACATSGRQRIKTYKPIDEADRIDDWLYLPETLYAFMSSAGHLCGCRTTQRRCGDRRAHALIRLGRTGGHFHCHDVSQDCAGHRAHVDTVERRHHAGGAHLVAGGRRANPVPAILEYLPYRKRDGTYERDALTHPYLAGHGYAGVRVDLRGSGKSSGLLFDEYATQEHDDGVELIAWLAAQPWCNGAVGMMGISWGGFNGLQIAARRPPALKAIVTLCSTDDRYADDAHYMGGTFLTTAGLEWAFFFFSLMCLPPDPALVGDGWRATWLERLNNIPLFQDNWLQHQRRDAYWKHGSVCEDYAAIRCPVYAVGGWTDGYKNAIQRLLERLTVPRKGLVGPWGHAYPHFAMPGPQIGFLQEILRWWDYWLKDVDTGVMDEPMLRAWMTESVKPATHHDTLPGRWIAEPSWPPPEIIPRRLFLTDAGLRQAAAPLTARAVCSPQTVGKCGGYWVPFGRGHDQAGDQQEDDVRSLTFETPPLEEPIEILGAPIVTLDVSSDRPIAI